MKLFLAQQPLLEILPVAWAAIALHIWIYPAHTLYLDGVEDKGALIRGKDSTDW